MESPLLQTNINSDEAQARMEGEKEKNYYQEYCKLFVANIVLSQQLKDIVKEKNDLKVKLAQLEQKQTLNGIQKQEEEKTKRFRRQAAEIERHYKCPYQNCSKVYGQQQQQKFQQSKRAEGSLNQHIRLKHPEYNFGSQQEQEEKQQN